MAYADTLSALDPAAPPPPSPAAPGGDGGSATPSSGRAPMPSSGGTSPYQRTMDALNAALDGGGDGSPRPLTIERGPTYAHTAAALNAMLDAPEGTPIIMGAAPVVPASLTPRGSPQPDSPPPPTPAASRSERLYSDDALGLPPTSSAPPQPAPGPLSNSADDGYLSGAAKGAATGAIKGVGDSIGFVGGLGNLADYLIARGESAVTGKPVDQVMAAHAARRKAVEADMSQTGLGRLAVATDPTNLLPAPDDVSGPILARTGAYQPTSEAGRIAQAAVEAVPAMLGPGGGMVSPGTAGRAVVGALARQAPAMALGGAASQGAVDATGSPLAGLAAGIAVPALAEGGVALGRGGIVNAGKLLAPVAGGSDRLNNAPVIGPALQAGREAAVAQKIVGQSSDPAALRAWAATQPAPPDVPNSPRTLAGAVGDDPGLFQAEKDARNVNNARPTASVTVDGQTYGGQSFNGIDRAQSDAQVAALGSGQQGADVFRPGQTIAARMDAIEAAAQGAEDRLNAAHADAVQQTAQAGQQFASDQQSALAGRAVDRTQAGLDFAAQQRSDLAEREAARVQAAADDRAQAQADRDGAHAQLVQGFKDAQARATDAAQQAASGLGQPVDDDSLGGALRASIEAVRQGAKEINRRLYRAVDPDGTLAMVASPIGDAAQRIAGQLQGNGADLSAVEAPLFRRAAALPDVATYGTVHQLDADLSAAMSAERRSAGESPAWARLSQLKGAVKDAMTNAADNQAAHEARLVQAGAMAPEDTMVSRLKADFDANRSVEQPEAGRATGTDNGASSSARAPSDFGTDGAQVSRGGGPGAAAGGAGLQADAGRAGQAAPEAGPGGVAPLANAAPGAAPARGPTISEQIRARIPNAEAGLRQAFGEERGAKLAANPDQAIAWAATPESMGPNSFPLARQRDAIVAYGRAAREARDAIRAEIRERDRAAYAEQDRNASPLDRRVGADDPRPATSEIRPGPDGEDYLYQGRTFNHIDRTSTDRWGKLGQPETLGDMIAAHRSIAAPRPGTPLAASADLVQGVVERMGLGDTRVYSMAPDAYDQVRRGSLGLYIPHNRSVLLREGGSAEQQLHTAIHEAVHATFWHALEKDQGLRDGVDALLDHARRNLSGAAAPEEFSSTYGLTNRQEFVAEAFTNPAFQRRLADVPASRELLQKLGLDGARGAIRTAWDAFMRTVGKAFGLPQDPQTMSLLEATARVGDRIEGAAARTPRDLRGLIDHGDLEPAAAPNMGPNDPRPDAPPYDPDGLRAPRRPDAPRPQDLRAFVRAHGGVIDSGGDLASMGMHDLVARGGKGLSADRMREAAAEAGYLGGDTAAAMRETTPNDLLDALSGDRPVHSVRDGDAAAAWDAYDEAKERYDAARGEFGIRSTFGVKRDPLPLDSYGRDDVEGPNGPQMREPAISGLRPNFGPEAAARLKAANAAYAEYARTYKNPIVGPGLRSTGFSGDYQRGDAAFIRGAIKPGPLGYENARAHLLAAKNDPEAVEAMHDAALNPLRRAALGPGFLPPQALKNWRDSYGPALRALDEVTPGFSSRFDDAGHATQALLDLGAEHKAAAASAQKEAARQAVLDDADRRTRLGQANAADRDAVSSLLAERKVNDRADAAAERASTSAALADRAASDRDAIGASKAATAEGIGRARDILREARATPAAKFAAGGGTGVASTEVENAVGGYLKTGTGGATRMRGLVQSVASDPDALDGLRKAGTDWLVRSHTNADGSLSGAKLIQFLKNNADTLRELYPHEQLSMMGAVARDAEAGARWRTSTAVKGGSDSVKNLLAAVSEGHGRSSHATLGLVATEAVMQGFEHGGVIGAATGGVGAAALYMMDAMRQAGIRRTSDLYMAALADPELARALISKMPTSASAGPVTAFARSLRRGLILGPMVARRPAQARQGAAR